MLWRVVLQVLYAQTNLLIKGRAMDNDRVKRPYHKSADRWNIGKKQENPAQVETEKEVEVEIDVSGNIEPKNSREVTLEVTSRKKATFTEELTYNDLPESTKIGVEKSILFRKNLNLEDDSELRKLNAVKYRKFELERMR
jgi:hypothetical protein